MKHPGMGPGQTRLIWQWCVPQGLLTKAQAFGREGNTHRESVLLKATESIARCEHAILASARPGRAYSGSVIRHAPVVCPGRAFSYPSTDSPT